MYFTCFRRWVLGFVYRQACWLAVQSEVNWDRNYSSANTCHCCSWKMKGAMTWGDELAGKWRGTLPSSPQIHAHVPSCAMYVDRISRKLPEVVALYLHDRRNFFSVVNPFLGWDLGGKIVSHLEMPRGFPGMRLCLAWNGSRLFSLSPKLFMPETTDSFSIRQISWNFWGPGKHTTFPTPTPGGFGLDLWVLA